MLIVADEAHKILLFKHSALNSVEIWYDLLGFILQVPFGKIIKCPTCMVAVAVAQPQQGIQVRTSRSLVVSDACHQI